MFLFKQCKIASCARGTPSQTDPRSNSIIYAVANGRVQPLSSVHFTSSRWRCPKKKNLKNYHSSVYECTRDEKEQKPIHQFKFLGGS